MPLLLLLHCVLGCIAGDRVPQASCKPRPPVSVTIAAIAAPGTWRIEVEALEMAGAVRITAGAGETPAGGTTVWTGALAAGERRMFETRLPAPAGAASVWAAADAGAGRATLRGVASAAIPGVASKSIAGASGGQRVVDARTGDAVFEFRGRSGGGR